MRKIFTHASLAALLATSVAAFAQPASSAGQMGAAKPIGVSASTAVAAQQKAASNAGSIGTVVRTSEGPGAKAAHAKDSAMEHTKMTGARAGHPDAAASGTPMSK